MMEMMENALPFYRDVAQAVYRSPLDKTKRCLFGPPDPIETERYLRREMEIQLELEANKWAFDFYHELPLDGDFQWSVATPTKGPSRPVKETRRPTYDLSEFYYTMPDSPLKAKEPEAQKFEFKPIEPVRVLSFDSGSSSKDTSPLTHPFGSTRKDEGKAKAACTLKAPHKAVMKQRLLTDYLAKTKRPSTSAKKEDAKDRSPAVKKAKLSERPIS